MSKPVSLEEAVERVRARTEAAVAARRRLADDERFERISLADALGRRLGEDLVAPGPWPATDRSAMDGFAFATAGHGVEAGSSHPVVGASLAGHPYDGPALRSGQAVRIMTGGVVPDGADTVVMVEATDGYEGDTVRVDERVEAGANIRRQGSEIATGDLLLASGVRIRAAEVGALAVLGRAELSVHRRPRVGILATGDEVVPIEAEPAVHQVRNSNAHALAAQVSENGGEAVHLGICADTPEALRASLQRGLEEADIVLTIGGVSKGTHDLVHGTLAELGVEPLFHGVAIKPGKPAFFGQRADGPEHAGFVFGLPGNPASTFTTFDLLVRPLLLRLAGAPEHELACVMPLRLASGSAPFRKNWRAQAIPAQVHFEDGEVRAALARTRPSGDPFGLCDGDGYLLVPGDADPGSLDRFEFVPYDAAWP